LIPHPFGYFIDVFTCDIWFSRYERQIKIGRNQVGMLAFRTVFCLILQRAFRARSPLSGFAAKWFSVVFNDPHARWFSSF